MTLTKEYSKMNEWQKIETAPKDGTLVDLRVDGDIKEKCKWFKGCWAQFIIDHENGNDEVNLFGSHAVIQWRPRAASATRPA